MGVLFFFRHTYVSLKFVVLQSYSQRWATSRTMFSQGQHLEELLRSQRPLAAPTLVRVPVRVPLALRHSQMHRKVLQARAKVGRSSSQEDATQRTTSIIFKIGGPLDIKSR